MKVTMTSGDQCEHREVTRRRIPMHDVFQVPTNPPPVVPKSALSTPLPESLPLPLPQQQQQQEWETKLRHSDQELRQTQDRLHGALQRLADCQSTISQLEGLVRSLKGVVLHLDPIQGALILNHEIAAMEEMLVHRGGETTTGRIQTTAQPLAGRGGLRNHVEGQPSLASSDTPDAYVYRERLESTAASEGVPSSSSSTITVLLEPSSGRTTIPVTSHNKSDKGRYFVSTSLPQSHKARISPNKSPQESMIEEAMQRRMPQKQKQDSVAAHTSQSSSMNENGGSSSSSSSFVWGMLEQLTGQTMGILNSSASSFPVLASTQDHYHSNSLERDMETMERELSITNGRLRSLSLEALGSSKPQHARIETISAYPCDQELMIQQALMNKKLRDKEQARSASNTGIDSRQNMESLSSSKTFVGLSSETSITGALPPSVPRKRDSQATTLGEKRQDPRIMTMSHYPSDQEIMIQKALKKRREEEQNRLQESSSSTILLEQKAGGVVPVAAHNDNANDRRFVSAPAAHPQTASTSQNKSAQESMIEDVVRRRIMQQTHRLDADTSRTSTNNGNGSGGSRVWGMLEQLTGQTLGILSSSVSSSPVSASTRENSKSQEREMKTMEEELSVTNGRLRMPRADVLRPYQGEVPDYQKNNFWMAAVSDPGCIIRPMPWDISDKIHGS